MRQNPETWFKPYGTNECNRVCALAGDRWSTGAIAHAVYGADTPYTRGRVTRVLHVSEVLLSRERAYFRGAIARLVEIDRKLGRLNIA